jgi:hypothetical protein
METLKVKTSELLAIRDESTSMLSREKLSFLAKFQITSIHGELVSKLEPFDKIRKELVEKYGTLDEKKENYIIADEHKETFATELQTLLDAEVEFTFTPMPISIIGSMETPNAYYQVFKLFKN